jgi:hypothetical protein
MHEFKPTNINVEAFLAMPEPPKPCKCCTGKKTLPDSLVSDLVFLFSEKVRDDEK